MTVTDVFQSTLPGWGATDGTDKQFIAREFQSTLPGWGATHGRTPIEVFFFISIHAPRMGSDGIPLDANRISSRFQSTLPGWGATEYEPLASLTYWYFNPRSPDGERLAPLRRRSRRCLFLVKSVFRVSSLIFFGFRHEECRPVVCFTGCPSCRT